MCREALTAMGYSANDFDEFYGKGSYSTPAEDYLAGTTDRPPGCTLCLGDGNIPYRIFFFSVHRAFGLLMIFSDR